MIEKSIRLTRKKLMPKHSIISIKSTRRISIPDKKELVVIYFLGKDCEKSSRVITKLYY